MKGYKAFDKNLRCRDMQYEVGKEYKMGTQPVICKNGYHFCENMADVYKYYPMEKETRICVVEAVGDIVTDGTGKYCTNHIVIEEEVIDEKEKHCNANKSINGYCNTGDRNTGNRNTGDSNTKNWNTGYRNTGYSNTGDSNTGNRNTGYRNTGNRNTGDRNTGDSNTGDSNTGNRNTGNSNTGDWNTGDWNTTNHSNGCFCTEMNNYIPMFDKISSMTYEDWLNSRARSVLNKKPSLTVEWIGKSEMTDEEKNENPTYRTTGGYLKVYDKSETSQLWWDGLSETDKESVMTLPNFDADKFYKCTGIKVEK